MRCDAMRCDAMRCGAGSHAPVHEHVHVLVVISEWRHILISQMLLFPTRPVFEQKLPLFHARLYRRELVIRVARSLLWNPAVVTLPF